MKKTQQKLAKTSSPYEALDLKDQMMVDMYLDNVPMKFIAQQFKLNYSHVRAIFSEGGRLYEAKIYRQLEQKEEYDKKYEEVNEKLKETAVEAVVTLRREVRKGGMTGVIAARDVLDRAGFKPIDKFQDATPTEVHIYHEKVEVTDVSELIPPLQGNIAATDRPQLPE